MQLINMIISFLIYPFYSSMITIKELFKEKRTRIDLEAMQDSFYMMNFFMLFSRYIILLTSVAACVLAIYISKKFLGNPILNFALGISLFIIAYWITSVLVFCVQVISWISTTVRKVLKEVELMSKRTEDEIKKIVH